MNEVNGPSQVDVWDEIAKFVITSSESDESVRQFVLNAVGFSHEDLRDDQCRAIYRCRYHKQVPS